MRILIVKTSSLGDVVHTLPALTDAARALPELRCDWLVERPFAEIPAWHPAVDRVIACDLRGWRKRPLKTLINGDWQRFRAELRQREYAYLIDAQGLLKSAWLGWQARGPLVGADAASAREPLAACFYRRRYPVPAHDAAHAIERTRRLFAQALGYPLPEQTGAPDAGLNRGQFPLPDLTAPYAVFLHGTTWPSKRWPLAHWQTLGAALAARGLRIVLPWGNADERADAETIAAACNGHVLPRLGLTALAGWLAGARIVVGVDTGLMHLAAALGTPGLSLYGPTLPQRTGAWGRNQHWLWNETATTIDRNRPLNILPAAVLEKLAESQAN
jgi:heptosyltransferase I